MPELVSGIVAKGRTVHRTIQTFGPSMDSISTREYQGFQRAFDFFNSELFDSTLPQVHFTLNRHPKSRGYFSVDRFTARHGESRVHEIALNPDTFPGHTDEKILSTLVHEMVHLWQQTFGKPPRSGYHDRQWGGKMESVGLIPSHTGEPDGKRTGQKMTHYIQANGQYALVYEKLQATGFRLNWESREDLHTVKKKQKRESKTKFTCPGCHQNAWAKFEAKLVCGVCFEVNDGIIEYMLSESSMLAGQRKVPRR